MNCCSTILNVRRSPKLSGGFARGDDGRRETRGLMTLKRLVMVLQNDQLLYFATANSMPVPERPFIQVSKPETASFRPPLRMFSHRRKACTDSQSRHQYRQAARSLTEPSGRCCE